MTFLERQYPPDQKTLHLCALFLDLIIHFLLQHYQTRSASLLSCFETIGKAACLSLSDLSMSARTSFHKFISETAYMFQLMDLVHVSAITVRRTIGRRLHPPRMTASLI